MRVLFLGCFRENSGWSEGAARYALALDAAGVDVVVRTLKLNDAAPALPARLLELEARPARSYDAVIQNVLPCHMEADARVGLNVGLYFSETDSLRYSGWADRLNLMDEAWGCNREMRAVATSSFVTVPYRVFPIPADTTVYERVWEPMPGPKKEGTFLFYTVGEMVRRKNLMATLKAFHTEFDPDEPVGLVIKTSLPGMPAHVCRRHVEAFCDEIKRGLRLYPDAGYYKKEVVLTDPLSREDLFRLHATCDCFVQPSYGEAWSIPAFDAMALGRTPIVTDCGGYADYVSDETGWLVPARREPVFGVDDTLPDLFTAREAWWSVDHFALRRAMREAFEDRGLRQQKAAAGAKRAHDFSLEKVGKDMSLALQEALSHGRKALA